MHEKNTRKPDPSRQDLRRRPNGAWCHGIAGALLRFAAFVHVVAADGGCSVDAELGAVRRR